jgi:putative Mg2+ transporter-C (MgtC) family protein
VHVSGGEDALRVLLALVLAYAVGYERQVRGGRAGNRTYALVGIGGAMVGVLAQHGQPTVITGILSGVGFLGAGLLLRPAANMVTGLSSAAAILATAAIGAAVGQGLLLVGSLATVMMLVLLEIPLVKGLRVLDAGHLAHRFENDPSHRDDPGA